MADKALYSLEELESKTIEELDGMLSEHGYDANDFDDIDFRVEVLSRLIDC